MVFNDTFSAALDATQGLGVAELDALLALAGLATRIAAVCGEVQALPPTQRAWVHARAAVLLRAEHKHATAEVLGRIDTLWEHADREGIRDAAR